MSISLGRIVAEITANTAGLRRGAADAERILNDTSNNASAVGKAIQVAFAVTAALGVVKLIDKLEDCTQVAIDNKKALMGLESVAKAYGVSVDDATKATKDFTKDGLLQMKSATTGMKNILSTGFNITEAMNLSQALKDIGAFNNVTGDLGQAYEDVTKGMRTGSIELIENIGLTQKLSAVMKAKNIDISNGIDLTNNATQREAFYNMVLKEGEKFKGNAAKLASDQASSQEKANAAMKEAADAIGNRLLPAYSGLMGAVADISKGLTSIFSKNRIDEANEYAEAVKKQKTQFDELSITYTRLRANQNKTKEETKVYQDTIAELKKQYPDFLEKIDMEKEAYNGVAIALAKINEQLNKKLLFSMKEKEMAKEQQRIIDAEVKKYEATLNYNKALSKQQALINQYAEKKEKIAKGRYVTTENGFEFVKFTDKDAKKDKEIKYVNGEYVKKMLVAEDEAAARIEREKLRVMKDNFSKEIASYDAEKADATNKMIAINKKYDTILGGYDAKAEDKAKADAEAKAAAKKKAEEAAAAAAATAGKKSKKETFSLDTSETTKQKLIEQEYKYKVDLANAKEEEKWRVELENKKAVAIIKAAAEAEKKIAAIRKRVEKGELPEKAGRKQAVAINEQLATDIGSLELDLVVNVKLKEESIQAGIDNWAKISGQIYGSIFGDAINEELQNKIDDFKANKVLNKIQGRKYQTMYLGDQSQAVGLTNPEQYMTNYAQQGLGGRTKEEAEYVKKSLDDVTKSFSELAGVLNNEVISAISNIANEAMSMGGSIKGFSAAQAAGDTLGMLTGGIGIFSSAVSIFQSVGGLFHKSTYNFDEAVKKMLKGIGEKTPELQVAEYQKAIALKAGREVLEKYEPNPNLVDMSFEEYKRQLAIMFEELRKVGAYDYYVELKTDPKGVNELIANMDKIIPQLAEQLGTAAGDFGSAIGSALSSSATSEELKANLYDSIYGTVKSGLINAFLAGEVMKPLLDNLQQTVTLAVASGGINDTEKAAIQALFGEVGIKTDEFYSALEAVGLNVVDAAGQLNQAADRMDNVNRNLRLADRISTITTMQIGGIGIPSLPGGTTVYDFSNANLGGMTEQQVISAVSKANRMASIRKVGV